MPARVACCQSIIQVIRNQLLGLTGYRIYLKVGCQELIDLRKPLKTWG